MDKSDYLIVSGDTGICWNGFDEKGNDRDQSLKDMYNKKKVTTLWIDGNHENFDMLNALPVENWQGGKVHKVRENVLHLMRGEIFTIEGKTFFCFGGATSTDKEDRKAGVTCGNKKILALQSLIMLYLTWSSMTSLLTM